MKRYLSVTLPTTNLTDVEYKFFDSFGIPVSNSDWSISGVMEEKVLETGTGVYGVLVDSPVNASIMRWRSRANHTIFNTLLITLSKTLPYLNNLQRLSVDEFNYNFDSRAMLNGPATLTAFSKGSDGLWIKGSREITISNNLSNNTYYKEFSYDVKQDNLLIKKIHFGLDSYDLDPNIQRRGYLQIGFRTEGEIMGKELTPVQYENWWKQFSNGKIKQGVSWKQNGNETRNLTESRITQFHLDEILDEPKKIVYIGLKITPTEILVGHELNAEKIIKIREYEKGTYVIITKNPAQIWNYDENGLELFKDFTFYGEITDLTYLKEITYIALANGKLVQVYDDDERNDFEISPVGEEKPLRFLENNGEEVIAIYADDNSTTAYTLYDLKKVWEFDFKFDFVKLVGKKLICVSSNKLYVSEDSGMTIPILDPFSSTLNSFPYPITAVSLKLISTSEGKIYFKGPSGNYDILIDTEYSNIRCLEYAKIGAESIRAFASINYQPNSLSNKNLLESNLDMSWSQRNLICPSITDPNVFSRISDMWHYSKEKTPASGTKDTADYIEAVIEDKLLITLDGNTGTKGALLVVMEKSKINESNGAVMVSKISYPDIFAEEVIPENDIEKPIPITVPKFVFAETPTDTIG